MKRTEVSAAVVVLVALAIVACQNTLSGAPEPAYRLGPNEGAIRISFGENWISASNVLPDIAGELRITRYEVALTGPGGVELDGTILVPDTTTTFYPLVPGEWTVEVEAFNAEDELMGVGGSTISVLGGRTARADIAIGPVDGDGDLDLSFTWPDSEADRLEASIIPVGGSEDTRRALTFDLDTTEPGVITATYSSMGDGHDPFAAGSYELSVTLFNGSEEVYGLFETRIAVWILAGRVSAAAYTVDDEGGLEVTLNTDLYLYDSLAFTVDYSPAGAEAGQVEVDLSLGAGAPDPDQISWYLNGNLVENLGVAEKVVLLGPLSVGRYWLDVIVRKGNMISSHGQRLTVSAD